MQASAYMGIYKTSGPERTEQLKQVAEKEEESHRHSYSQVRGEGVRTSWVNQLYTEFVIYCNRGS